jgi:hypothetical protein
MSDRGRSVPGLYRVIIARYEDLFRVVTVTKKSISVAWVDSSTLGSDSRLIDEFTRSAGPVLFDKETLTDVSGDVSPAPRVAPIQLRHSEDIMFMLPTFKDIPDPAMLQSITQPSRIHSVDWRKRTVVISYATSMERSTMSWHDITVLNPQLLAKFLVEQGQ